MFQLKISAAIFAVVLALMGFSYYAITSSVTESVVTAEDEKLTVARRGVATNRLSAEASLRILSGEVAADEEVSAELARLQKMALDSGGLAPLKDQLNRRRVFDRLIEWSKGYAQSLNDSGVSSDASSAGALHDQMLGSAARHWWGAKPDLLLAFVATPLKGERIAHVLAAHAEEGQEIAGGRDYTENLPVLVAAEKAASVGVVTWTIHEYFVVASPVFDAAGTLVGTVAVGYQLDSALADRFGAVASGEADVIVYSDKRLYAGSGSDYKDGLTGAEYSPVGGGSIDEDTVVAYEDLEIGQSYVGSVSGHERMIQRHSWSGSEGAVLGFLVVSDYAEAAAPVGDLKLQLLLVGALLLVLGLLVTMAIVRNFLKPLEEIAVGIQEILNGNKDYLFRALPGNSIHGALVNSLNNLTAFLQGRAAPGEAEQAWDELMVDLEPERPSIYGMQAVQVVHSDEERAALQALYDDYMQKRKEHDQHVDMDFDRFCRRIRRNETSLKEKHNASSVEFSVAVSDGKVVLKPTLNFD